jgi:hypothetical protein
VKLAAIAARIHFASGPVPAKGWEKVAAPKGQPASLACWVLPPAYADSLFLPLSLRRANTLRPLAVFIRLRKPWTFFRWRFLGW